MKKTDCSADERAEPTGEIAPRWLHLDDIGTQVGEQQTGVGSGDKLATSMTRTPAERCGHTRSITRAIPWPTPMHIVARP